MDVPATLSRARMDLPRLVIFALPWLPMAFIQVPLGMFIPAFYATNTTTTLAAVGAATGIARIFDAIIDPLIGHLSDLTRNRWGRRRPWIAGAFIPAGLFFYLLWVPPSPLVRGGQVPLFAYFMAVVLIYDLLWTIVVMNWSALFPEMIVEPGDRATVSGCDDPESGGETVDSNGFFSRAGYFVIPKKLEVAARYSMLDTDEDINDDIAREYTGGINYYFRGHRSKIQTDVGHFVTEEGDGQDKNENRVRLQYQIIF